MKLILKSLSLIICLCIISSCSNDENNQVRPSIEELEITSGKIGDIIIINGEGFSEVNSQNLVKFNLVVAEVIEATSTMLKVIIPQFASSGLITLSVNDGETINVGYFEIIEEKVYTGQFVWLRNQEEIDEFGDQEYTKLEGDLRIGTPGVTNLSITNLDKLNSITFIGNSLVIHSNFSLTNLEGLKNVIYVGSIFMEANHNLTNLDGLRNLTTVNGNLTIQKHFKLSNINALRNITSVERLFIDSNDSLENLSGLENLIQIKQDLILQKNNSLTNIDALANITSVEKISISFHQNLTNLDGLKNLTKINDNLLIQDNSALNNLDGLISLLKINESLRVISNTSLSNLCGLQTLLNNNGLIGQYNVSTNAYNPSKQDIIDGNCSQ